jgi:hypothetical protein
MFAFAGIYNSTVNRCIISDSNLISYNHFVSNRLFRYVNLLADTAKSGKAEDLGYHFWTTTIGNSAEMLYGTKNDEALSRRITEVELLIFRQRTIGTPFHDYVPLVSLAEKLILAGKDTLRPLYDVLGISKAIDDFDHAEKNAQVLRDAEAGYCKQLTQELHERIEQGDQTPSQLGDLIRAYGMGLTSQDEFRLATTIIGSGMGMGTLLTWLAPKLAAHPEMQEKAFSAMKEVYGDEYPDPLDTDRIEYIKALGLEAGRVFTSARLGFPRETTQDTVIDGHHIPSGTLVMHNSHQINRDPTRYDQPEEFIPERWMNGHYGRVDSKTVKVGFPHMNHGVGRRVCVGIPCKCLLDDAFKDLLIIPSCRR